MVNSPITISLTFSKTVPIHRPTISPMCYANLPFHRPVHKFSTNDQLTTENWPTILPEASLAYQWLAPNTEGWLLLHLFSLVVTTFSIPLGPFLPFQASKSAHQCCPSWLRWKTTTLKMHNWLLALVGKHCSLIWGKVGGIQVLAGLAPSSQTVGSNKEAPGATKGGFWNDSFEVAPLVAPENSSQTLKAYNS